MKRKLTNGKKIIKLRDKNSKIKSNREQLIQIVEAFYETLYTNQVWGSFDPNLRGERLLEWLVITDLILLNQGDRPTFQNANR